MSMLMELRAHPLADAGSVHVPSGLTIQQMLEHAANGQPLASSLVVSINGRVVPVKLWPMVKPKQGTRISVVRDDLAGGGDGWKQVLGAVVLIVVAWFAPYLGGAAASATGIGTAATWGAAITLVASIAVSALIAPPTPSGTGNMSSTQWNQLTGTSNQINPGGVIPLVIGEAIFYPPHAALPYSEMVGETSYQHCLFDLGHGDIEVSDIAIGDTPLENFTNVQYEITRTPTLYTNDVAESAVNANLDDGDTVQRSAAPGCTSMGFNLVFPSGLFGVGTSGKDFGMWVAFQVRYREVGTTAWIVPSAPRVSGIRMGGITEAPTADFTVQATKKAPFAVGMSWDVPAGKNHEMELIRLSTGRGGSKNTYVDDCTWTILRSVTAVNPSTTGTLKLAMRIQATDQVTGTLQTLSLRAKQRISVYDYTAGTWSAPVTETNTAWVVWWLMTTCEAIVTHAPVSRMDLEAFADFAEYCTLHGFKARTVQDVETTVGTLLQMVLSGSLASLGRREDKYTVVFDPGDLSEAEDVRTFTPLEIKDFKSSRPFVELPHALRVQFKNPDSDWADDEIIVLDEGYSYRGVDARGNPSSAPEPTRFETLSYELAMTAQQAWQNARYHFAQGKFRPTTHSWTTDWAGLANARGDVVDVAHDVVQWGRGWGRVQSVAANASSSLPGVCMLILDQRVQIPPGQSIGVQLRLNDGSRFNSRATPHSVDTEVFYLDTAPDFALARGCAAVIGDLGNETQRLLLTGIRYKTGFGCDMSAVAYDERVGPFWANPPASIISEVTGTNVSRPDAPVIAGVVSKPANDETNDAGTITPTVHIGVAGRSSYLDILTGSNTTAKVTNHGGVATTGYEARWRVYNATYENAWSSQQYPLSPSISIRGLSRGVTYDIQVRSLAAGGRTSDWVDCPVTVGTTNREGTLALPSNIVGNVASTWTASSSVTYAATDSVATISASAATLVSAGTSISYGASSVSVTGTASTTHTFYLYYDDPTLQGGSLELGITEDYIESVNGYGRIAIGQLVVTFAATGGSSSGGGSVGGGGGAGGGRNPACPWVMAWVIERDRGLLQAGEVLVGDWLLGPGGVYRQVTHSKRRTVAGVRIVTEQLHALTCSTTAPILTDHDFVLAPAALGRTVAINGDRSELLADVVHLGDIEVQHITLDAKHYHDRVFLVGDDPAHLFPHHNLKAMDPEL